MSATDAAVLPETQTEPPEISAAPADQGDATLVDSLGQADTGLADPLGGEGDAVQMFNNAKAAGAKAGSGPKVEETFTPLDQVVESLAE